MEYVARRVTVAHLTEAHATVARWRFRGVHRSPESAATSTPVKASAVGRLCTLLASAHAWPQALWVHKCTSQTSEEELGQRTSRQEFPREKWHSTCSRRRSPAGERLDRMAWHFYQGVRDEWRWYRVDSCGRVMQHAERAFSDLAACMANAERCGFAPNAFHVHARAAANAPTYTRGREKTPRPAADASIGTPADWPEPSQRS